jgi:hypothetical protein
MLAPLIAVWICYRTTFLARSNRFELIVSLADSAAARLISKRTLFSSIQSRIIPPEARKTSAILPKTTSLRNITLSQTDKL